MGVVTRPGVWSGARVSPCVDRYWPAAGRWRKIR